jgi:hypothetical protein
MSAPTGTWDSTFETVPAGSDNLSVGDDAIRALKAAISTRFGREHHGLTSDTNSKHGWHKAGSAVAFYQVSAPTAKPEASGAVLDTDDTGRLFHRSGDNVLLVWTGSAWVGCTKEIARVSVQGTLAVTTNVVPAIVLPRACTILKVSARVGTAPTGASLLIDINKNGNTGQSIFNGATRITIAAASSADNKTTFDGSYGVLAADDYLTVDIDQVGSTIAGADLGLTIEVRID